MAHPPFLIQDTHSPIAISYSRLMDWLIHPSLFNPFMGPPTPSLLTQLPSFKTLMAIKINCYLLFLANERQPWQCSSFALTKCHSTSSDLVSLVGARSHIGEMSSTRLTHSLMEAIIHPAVACGRLQAPKLFPLGTEPAVYGPPGMPHATMPCSCLYSPINWGCRFFTARNVSPSAIRWFP